MKDCICHYSIKIWLKYIKENLKNPIATKNPIAEIEKSMIERTYNLIDNEKYNSNKK